jgi:hypothetical protein
MNLTYDPLDPATYGNVSIYNSGTVYAASTDYTWTGPSMTQNGTKIHVQGDAVFEGNITWQDRDMREWFESVEARLAILKPNTNLEKEWSELAELRQRYVELERDIIAKQKLFDILKKQ